HRNHFAILLILLPASNLSAHGGRKLSVHSAILMDMTTGWVAKGGYHIVATAKRGNIRLIAVVMGAKTPAIRAKEAERLMDEGFRIVLEDHLQG
ncbi:MAG: hypothetical protein KKD68_10975, partial [Proteobacteria bacterium]|nr:hypothetical protein [Pseudomonadota bacterium]